MVVQNHAVKLLQNSAYIHDSSIKNAVIISTAYLETFNVGCLKVATPYL